MNTIFDINNNCTIDSSGLIVGYHSEGSGAKSSSGRCKGKGYYEVESTVDTIVEWSSYIGLSCGNIDLSSKNSFPAENCLFFRILGDYPAIRIGFGDLYADYSLDSKLYTNPGVVGLAIDFDTQKIKYYYNGVHITDYSYRNTAIQPKSFLYPYVLDNVNYVGRFKFNFGMSKFKYAIPIGYQAWDFPNTHLYLKDNAVYGMQ